MAVFSKLTKAQRDKLPASDFGDPANRLFPIVDQDDVDSAARLIGKAKNPAAVKRRIIAIAKRKGLRIPDAWKADMSMGSGGDEAGQPAKGPPAAPLTVASFNMDAGGKFRDGDYIVYPNALLFEAGDYEDKAFTLSPEEQWAAVETFTPVWGNIEHTDFLRGRACHVRSIRLDDENSHRLRGEVAVPAWLDENLGDHERRLSCEWDRETKQLVGIGLVVHPRVSEAALMSAMEAFAASKAGKETPAFARSRHDTPSGQMAMQRVHDASVAGGAVCAPPDGGGSGSGQAKMASRHEARAIQQVHDVAVEHGASCEANGRSPGAMAGYFSNPPAPTRGKAAKVGRRRMNVLDWIKGKAEEEGVSLDDKDLTAAFNAPSKAEMEAAAKKHEEALQALHEQHQREMDAIRKQQEATAATFAAQATERRELEAAQFAERQVAAKKVPPAAREALAALAARVSHGDASATFGEGQKSTRALLDEFLAKLPDFSVFTTASIDPAQVAALFNEGGADEKTGLSEERRKHLLGATPLGRSIDRDKSASN